MMSKKKKEVTLDIETPPPKKREVWKSQAEFFLAVLGFSVGMGTLTRFPYIVYKNGGGAFLIPFILVLIIGGIPLFYLEVILGQFSGRSPLTMWVLVPAFKGIGYSMTLLTFIASIYYMPFTYSVVYLFASFNSTSVPWSNCGNYWNTEYCVEPSYAVADTSFNSTAPVQNSTLLINSTVRHSPAEEFFNEYVLGISQQDGIGDFGSFQWHVLLAHGFTWVLVFLCSFKGHVSAGKVVYVTATLPYVLLTILLIRGVTLEGYWDGIVFFLKPDWQRLADPNVWIEAAIQVVFQLGPAWGSLITMSRYNPFHHRCYREAVIIPICNLLTAIYGGIAIFSVLGHMAYRQGVPVDKVASAGPGLAFIAYPQAIALLPFPPFWSVVFFLVLITVAIDSQFAFFETIVSGFTDMFPRLLRYKIWVSVAFAVVLFLLGLPLCTQGGGYLWQILDWYGGVVTFTTVGFLESIAIAYIYGLKRFRYDASLMFGQPPGILVTIAWFSVTPLLMTIMTFVGLSNFKAPTYDYTNYSYPSSAIAFGWLVGIASFLPTPIMLVLVMARSSGSFLERLRTSFNATDAWVPSKPELVEDYRRLWYPSSDSTVTSLSGSMNGKTFVSSVRVYFYDNFLRTSYESKASLVRTDEDEDDAEIGLNDQDSNFGSKIDVKTVKQDLFPEASARLDQNVNLLEKHI